MLARLSAICKCCTCPYLLGVKELGEQLSFARITGSTDEDCLTFFPFAQKISNQDDQKSDGQNSYGHK